MDWTGIDDSPTRIRELLARRGLALKKRWGQNFMIAPGARTRIVSLAEVAPGERVWEVGPGLGGITELLASAGAELTVFEVDWGLVSIIRERFQDKVAVVAGDAVATLTQQTGLAPDKIVGNLPYRSAAAIVSAILEDRRLVGSVRRMVFTVQKEMALRMVATPGSKDYSAFSVLCSLCTTPTLHGDLSKGNFYPAPEVASSVVVMETTGAPVADLECATMVARGLFSSRRKTIGNNLKSLESQLGLSPGRLGGVAEGLGIPLGARAEELDPGAFLRLGREVSAATRDRPL